MQRTQVRIRTHGPLELSLVVRLHGSWGVDSSMIHSKRLLSCSWPRASRAAMRPDSSAQHGSAIADASRSQGKVEGWQECMKPGDLHPTFCRRRSSGPVVMLVVTNAFLHLFARRKRDSLGGRVEASVNEWISQEKWGLYAYVFQTSSRRWNLISHFVLSFSCIGTFFDTQLFYGREMHPG